MNILNSQDKSSKKEKLKTKKVWLFVALFVVAIVSSVIYISYGYYIKIDPTNLVLSGTVMVENPDIYLEVYVKEGNSYNAVSRIPTSGYTYNSSLTSCTSGVSITSYDATNRVFDVASSGQGYCRVYFVAT